MAKVHAAASEGWMTMKTFCTAGVIAVAASTLLVAEVQASQTPRRVGPCTVKAPSTVDDNQVVELGTEFQPGRSAGAKLQVGGNVTDVTWVMNHTDCPIRISKQGYSVAGAAGEIIEVPPRGSYNGHFWVPWRNTPEGESLWLSIKGRSYFYIWQMAGRLAFHSDAAYRRAADADWAQYKASYGRSPSVPGLSIEGGPRVLHVAMTKDGEPFFKFEGLPEE
jgi:hypothetical protein